jgi:anti-sigma B factor antagonist
VSVRTLIGDDLVCIVVAGELDLASADEVCAALEEYPGPVVLDLGEVTFLDSSGLRPLLVARRQAAQTSRSLPIAQVSGAARRVIELSGTASLFPPER